MKAVPALVLVCLLAAAGPQAAISDLVLAPGVFSELPADRAVGFRHSREGGAGAVDEGMTLTRTTAGGLAIAGRVPVAEFGAGSANPIALYFFESVVRSMSEATGGSPFYIRNRMREALSRTALSSAETVIEPFGKDPNRERMGVWGGLRLTIRADRAAPGGLAGLAAETVTAGGDYRETMTVETGG